MTDHRGVKARDVEGAEAFCAAPPSPLGYVRGIEHPGGLQLHVEGELGHVWVAPLPEGADGRTCLPPSCGRIRRLRCGR